MKTFLLIIIISAISAISAAAGVNPECEGKLADPKYFDKRKVAEDANGHWKFSKDNTTFFNEQRSLLRNLVTGVSSKYIEVEHALRRLLEAQMMETHVFLYGDPGAAKSGLTREVMSSKVLTPDGSTPIDMFSIQLNQLLGDGPIRGFIDHMKLKGGPITEDQISNKGAMIHFSKVLIDEIDKGNPVALAALLDILNEKIAQYGPVVVKVRTKTMVATSNMTIYEFLKAFADQSMEGTARALLDRIPFKVYMHNYPTTDEARLLIVRSGVKRFGDNSRNAMKNLQARYNRDLTAAIQKFESEIPGAELDWFGLLAGNGTVLVKDTDYIIASLIDGTREALYGMRTATEDAAMSAGMNSGGQTPIYYPPTIFSTRNIIEHDVKIIQMSVLLDLLLLPEEVLPTQKLIVMLEKGIPIDRFSTWRLQDVLLTAAAGDPILTFTDVTSSKKQKLVAALQYGPAIEILMKNPFDQRQRDMLRFIKEEREKFGAVFTQVLDNYQGQQDFVGDTLLELLGPEAKKIRNIEEFYFRAMPRVHPTARP